MIALQEASVTRGGQCLVGPLTLDLEPGRMTVIVGPNGAGKSTLIKLLSGEVKPSTGCATLDGTPLRLIRPSALAGRRAILAQSTDAGFGFTVAELTELGLRMLDGRTSRERQLQFVECAMAAVGLLPLADRPLSRLSGGERQRAHFARVLAQLRGGQLQHGPGVLLLDEPIAAQDLAHQLQVLSLARGCAAEGTAVAIVLHDLNWASVAADRLIVLRHGRIYADGPPEKVITASMLAEVFQVALLPGVVPESKRPFILPQVATSLTGDRV